MAGIGSRITGLAAALVAGLWLIAGAAVAETRYVVYYNSDATPLSKVAEAGYTHVILSFLTVDPAGGKAALALVEPDQISGQRSAITALKRAGKKVMISFGGGDMESAAWRRIAGREADLARLLDGYVRQYGLDGVDIDFEITEALQQHPPREDFDGKDLLIKLTRALRAALPAGALISHAPQPPYLDPRWEAAPYRDILKAVGEDIDWISVQYYNNPGYDGPARKHVVGQPQNPFVTAYIGLAEGGLGADWTPEKTLVGKPIFDKDAFSGHMPPARVRMEIVEPLMQRYGRRFGGLMGWQYSDLTEDHRYWNSRMAPSLYLE